MKPANPFLIYGYYSPEFFCNRLVEEERIISSLTNGRNITLFSIRRLGKTGLIEHVFHKLQSEKKIVLFYLDILATTNISAFVNSFASTVLGKLESKPEKFIKRAGEIFTSIRPIISFDPNTGTPNLQFNIQSTEEANNSLERIFDYLKFAENTFMGSISDIDNSSSSLFLNGGVVEGSVKISNSYIKLNNSSSALSDGSYVNGIISNSEIINASSGDTLSNTTSFGKLMVNNSTIISNSGTTINYSGGSPVILSNTILNTDFNINNISGEVAVNNDLFI